LHDPRERRPATHNGLFFPEEAAAQNPFETQRNSTAVPELLYPESTLPTGISLKKMPPFMTPKKGT